MIYLDLPDYIRLELRFSQLMADLANNGIQFDLAKCRQLIIDLTKEIQTIDNALVHLIPPKTTKLPNLKNVYKKDGMFTKAAQDYIISGKPYKILYESRFEPDLFNQYTQMERWIEEPANLNSTNQLRDYLLSLGWKPSEDPDRWNYKQYKTPYGKMVKVKDDSGNYLRTTPKIPNEDEELDQLASLSPSFKLIADRLKRANKLHTLEGYLKNVREDNRISMQINSCGTNTMRVTHSVVANVPRITSFYGSELRSLFTIPDNRVLVGADASGLEARIIAHYLNDDSFTKLILEGDIHQELYDNYFSSYLSGRPAMKNIFYAMLYGAGNAKLGSMCDAASGDINKLGKQVRALFKKSIPNMDVLQKRLESQYEKYKGVIGIDGRIVRCRNIYALLNTLCQSCGAILCKAWVVKTEAERKRLKIAAKLVIYYHDEFQYEIDKENAVQLGELMVDCIKWTQQHYKLNVPLDSKYVLGRNWSETH